MNDSLRIWAIGCQLLGFITLMTLRTYEVSSVWQILVFSLMLASALYIALLRRYRQHKRPKKD